MSRDKQTEIEEMAVELWHKTTIREAEMCDDVAEYLYNAGYRKIYDDHQRQCTCYALGCQMAESLKTEVAREIFEEIDDLRRYIILNEDIALKCKEENGEQNREYWKGKLSAFKQIQGFIDAELKKKYIGKDTNVTTKDTEGGE